MKKHFSILLSIFLLASTQCSAIDTLSNDARLTILTCSPGPDLYSIFGHTAIRLEDYGNSHNWDMVYNYGTFDYYTENFYVKFARGKLPYQLSVSSFGDFQIEYLQTGRGIWEQELLLTQAEKQKLFELLEENYLPENRTYQYDFFYDNCSTRIRDIIAKACNNDVNFTYVYARPHTFRQAIQSYLDYQPWSDFGIDLALGIPCDRVMQHTQGMFLPDSLMVEFNYAAHNDNALVKPIAEIIPAEYQLVSDTILTPILVFSLFFLIHFILGFYFIKSKKKIFILTDRLIFTIAGLVGVLVVFLWFFTDHHATVWNLNILWANPLLLLFAFLPVSKMVGWKRKFLKIYLGILLALLLCWFFLPQKLHLAVIPIVLSIMFTLIKVLRPELFFRTTNKKTHGHK